MSELTKDVSEVIVAERDRTRCRSSRLPAPASPAKRVAFHPPCSLQHGLKMRGQVEALLAELGVELVPVRDAHLCCGSAGTYSLLQPELAARLRENKLAALTRSRPEEIVTANIGCQSHLQCGDAIPVRHWIELVDDLLAAPAR